MADTYYRRLVSAGALVIILGLVIDPFLQAVISDYGVLVNLGDASVQNTAKAMIGKSNRFDSGTQCISILSSDYQKIDTTPDFAVAAALYDGLNAAVSHGYQNVSFTCASGNCTWAEYTSLAVRSTCFDISGLLKRTIPGDEADATTSTTQTSSSMGSAATTTSTNVASKSYQVESYGYGEASSNDYSDTSTLNSETAPTQSSSQATSIAPLNTSPPAGYGETVLSVFSDRSTVNSEVAPVKSTATQATVGLDKRAPSSTQSSSSQPQSSATWTDWTLEHLDLTLSNTNGAWRAANNFVVLQAAVVADPNLTINFINSQALLAAFTIIRTNNNSSLGSAAWDAADASAVECGLELALNVYNSSVNNNVLMEQVVASASKKVPESWLPLPPANQSDVDPNNLWVDPGTTESNPIYHQMFLHRYDYALDPTTLNTSANETFTVAQQSLVSTLGFLTSLIRQDNDNATVKAVLQQDRPPLHTYGSAILQPLFNQTNTTATFEAIARSMTNAIRSSGSNPVSGITQQWVRYYQVRWAFLTLPLSLLAIGTIFFILSVVDARKARVPTWKANGIASMVHGPDELLRQDLRNKNRDSSLGVAGETLAKLEWCRGGFALTAANDPAAPNSRPTTPARDEEEHEMHSVKVPTTPQTPGSNITLVEKQNVAEASEQGTIRSVSSIHSGPNWSDVQIEDSSTPLSVRRSV